MPSQNLPEQQKTVKSLNNNQEYIEKLIYIEKPYCFHFVFFKLSATGFTTKNRGAIKSILTRLYSYANMFHDLNLICPLDKMDFGCFSTIVVDNRNDVFSVDELDKLCEYMDNLQEKDDYDYAIMLLCEMIARIGEIKALKWSNIHEDYIWIANTIDSENNCLNRTKNKQICGNRENPLTERAKKILSQLTHEGEFVFSNKTGNHLTTDTVNRRLEKHCKAIGISYHSSHKIRFANISKLAEQGVSISTIQYWAGHANVEMTYKYIRSVKRPSREEYRSTMVHSSENKKNP